MAGKRVAKPLPVEALLPGLAAAWTQHRRLVLQAPPGAGKSTRLPEWLLQRADLCPGRVVLLQPRRLAAEQIAAYLAQRSGEPLGCRIGLSTRERRVVGPDTRLEVVTNGVFLRQIQSDPELCKVSTLLFDEFHERSWQGDLALALALESQQLRETPLHLLVMSATMPAERIGELLAAPVLQSAGRGHPVALEYRPRGRDPWDLHLGACVRDVLAEGARRVLVFLPGLRWMRQAHAALQWVLPAGTPVAALHAGLPARRQQAILQPGPAPDVILATNVAETSITIDGVDVVVDSGWVRRAIFEPRRGLDRLVTGMVARDAADQRAGRAGRLGPGRCIRLWSREQQGHLATTEEPAVRQSDLAPMALEVAAWGASRPEQLPLPDPPNPARWRAACDLLQSLGALNEHHRITHAGRTMVSLGVHPRLGRLLLAGRERGQLDAACWLAALLSEGDCWPEGDGIAPADIALRGRLLNRTSGRLQQLRQRLWRRLHGRAEPPASSASTLDGAGELLATAFPDRVARLRDGSADRYLSVAGFQLQLAEQDDSLRGAPWIVVADCDASGRIQLALRLDEATVTALAESRGEASITCHWDVENQRVQARELRQLGAILLAEQPVPAPPEGARSLLLQALRSGGLGTLRLDARTLAWLERVRWAGQHRPQWPDFSEQALLADLEQWLLPWVGEEVRGLADLQRGVDPGRLLRARLGHERLRELERLAPERWALPGGRAHPVDYGAEGGPLLSVRLQECLGLDRHPCLPETGQPLLLELLSPARRPLQLTRDLPGFWRGAYVEVRKEMRGRYPRHNWPADPWARPRD